MSKLIMSASWKDKNISRLNELNAQLERYIEQSGKQGGAMEGHSGGAVLERQFYSSVAELDWCGKESIHVCETGVNAGHSATMWLVSNPKVIYHGFDLGEHPYMKVAFDWIQQKFPGRASLEVGDSLQTIPRWGKSVGNELLCDIVHVDGGHSYNVALADVRNFHRLVHPHAVLLVDDSFCRQPWCVDDALQAAESLKLIKTIFGWTEAQNRRGFSLSRFVKCIGDD
eukprot:CAMPEP_0175811308 /NCGR_PEP_ID=MMETSP0107_2-20121207/3780_1 /TAXON_ID=195067 ORGANISM="Goniomonas pacifica, Strain CCMP1869" /NCGR_SAMPLE_ID=MMETSP0107_2 /ASSEMBLY_ACC=CAM_ASM_000203 /LENGTH=226 /DNA_ID=CAMNT_0017123107 /DNA_START=1 /DNA_END=681 /DNA_ORIENTATION=-